MWASHEARAAQNAQRMLDDGTWLVPRLYDGQPELQKPPAFYWLVAAAGSIRGGVDPVAARLPAVLAGWLTVVMVWWHLHRRGRGVAGFVAGAVLAGSVHFTGTARIGRIDVPLACVVTAVMLVARDGLQGRARLRQHREPLTAQALPVLTQPGSPPDANMGPRREQAMHSASPSRLVVLLLGLLGGFALLLKGPIGLVLPAGALGVYALVERFSVRRLILPGLATTGIALAIALPWYIRADVATDGQFTRTFFLYHHLNRAFGGAEALAGHPAWFYLPRFAADFLPWSPLLLVALVARRWRGDADARLGLVWLAVMVAVLSVSRFKRADYLLPAYPGAAIFLGCAVERWYFGRSDRSRRRAALCFGLVLTLLPAWWFGFDRVVTAKEQATREQAPFAKTIRELVPAPETVVLFRVESHLLAYHLGRPVHTLVEWADLDAHLRVPGPHYVVTRAEFLGEVRQAVPQPAEVVARDGDDRHRPLVLLRFGSPTWPTNPPRD